MPARAPGAQGQHVHAPARVAQPLVVADEGPGVGAREVAEGDGLGRARVGEAGHHARPPRPRPCAARARTRPATPSAQAVDGAADPEAQRGDRLLVAAAAEVALAREVAHDLAEARLHEAVDVLRVELQVGRSRPALAPAPARVPASSAAACSAGWRRSGRGPGRRRARPRSPRAAAAGRTGTSG